MALVMDGLASQAATGVHSTKKQRNVVTTVPKLLSRPTEEESEDDSEDLEGTPCLSPSLNQDTISPQPTSDVTENSIDPDESVTSPSAISPSEQENQSQPQPHSATASENMPSPSPPTTTEGEEEAVDAGDQSKTEAEVLESQDTAESPDVEKVPSPDYDREDVISPLKTPPPKPAPLNILPTDDTQAEPEGGGTGKETAREVPPPDNLLYTVSPS
jgi:hypothetical protein